MHPETHYARSGDIYIAYQATGSGPVDVVLAPGTVSHLDLDWESPPRANFFEGLSRFCRLLRFDKRGTGLSDRPLQMATLEERADDIRAVSDIPASIAWYTGLFSLPVETTTHEGKIYTVPMTGGVDLILDGHRPVANSSQPLCFFWTGDIHAAEVYLRANGVEITAGVQDIGSVSTLTFTDPDGNRLMACQRNG